MEGVWVWFGLRLRPPRRALISRHVLLVSTVAAKPALWVWDLPALTDRQTCNATPLQCTESVNWRGVGWSGGCGRLVAGSGGLVGFLMGYGDAATGDETGAGQRGEAVAGIGSIKPVERLRPAQGCVRWSMGGRWILRGEIGTMLWHML